MHNIKDFDFMWAGAYEEQFNVRLFNTAVRLATETTEAHKENPALLQKLAHLPWYQRVSGMDYFESREIRYFGELLERYGEKLGDDIANTRAVALAMAWTAPILTPNMFVGRQREDFMLKLNLLGEGDPYIAAALYRLSEGAAKDAWRANLIVREYARTEEIILALCSMDDPWRRMRVFTAGWCGRVLGLSKPAARRTMPSPRPYKPWRWGISGRTSPLIRR